MSLHRRNKNIHVGTILGPTRSFPVNAQSTAIFPRSSCQARDVFFFVFLLSNFPLSFSFLCCHPCAPLMLLRKVILLHPLGEANGKRTCLCSGTAFFHLLAHWITARSETLNWSLEKPLRDQNGRVTEMAKTITSPRLTQRNEHVGFKRVERFLAGAIKLLHVNSLYGA